MIIGIPHEIKTDEYRVSLTPDKVDLLIGNGHKVFLETGAGLGAGFKDSDYKTVGASIVNGPDDLFGHSEMVVKVKEPRPQEYKYFREDQILFTYLHLAPEHALTDALLSARVAGVAYETIQKKNGSLPLLYPMSEIAGKIAPQVATRLLQNISGVSGKLLGGVPGTEPCHVIVVGGGTVGFNAALMAKALGANVTVLDINLETLRHINAITHGAINTVFSTPSNVRRLLSNAQVVICAVLIPGARAPKVLTDEMVQRMPENSIIMDVAIDQGGSVEGIRSTTHREPTYVEHGVMHYAVPNMPGVVAHTSSMSLSNATYPYVLKLANFGVEEAAQQDCALAKGVNTFRGCLTHPAVAESQGVKYVSFEKALVT